MHTITEGKWIDLFVTYKFLRYLTTPWEKQDAYKLGIIDGDGKRIKSKEVKTEKEKDSFTMLHRLVFNFKRILHKIPLVKSKIGTYAAALFLLKEHMDEKEFNVLVEYIEESGDFQFNMNEEIGQLTKETAYKILEEDNMDIKEDAPANNMGDGQIADKPRKLKLDARTKAFKAVMRRIKERQQKKENKAVKEKLKAMGITSEGLDIAEGSKKDYEKFFQAAMKKFKIKSISSLSDKESKKFFAYIDKNWDAEDE